jgi:hypothetical protein
MSTKIYTIESNDDSDDDWDTGDFINGNKQLRHKGRRPRVYQLFSIR